MYADMAGWWNVWQCCECTYRPRMCLQHRLERKGEEKLLQWNMEPDQKPQKWLRIRHPWALWRRRTEEDRAGKNRAPIQTFFLWKHFEWARFSLCLTRINVRKELNTRKPSFFSLPKMNIMRFVVARWLSTQVLKEEAKSCFSSWWGLFFLLVLFLFGSGRDFQCFCPV